jgi:hypothetical protein
MAGLLGAIVALFGSGTSNGPGFPRGRLPIYRANSVNDDEGEYCEAAIAAHRFRWHGVNENERHVLSIQRGERAYVVLVEVQETPGLGKALVIKGTFESPLDQLSELIEELGGTRSK